MPEAIRVMLGSTTRELTEHRALALEAIRTLNLTICAMETLPNQEADPISAALIMVNDADVYVGLVGWRYGYVPSGHALSVIEIEYDRAVKRDLPRLILLMHEEHPIRPADVERGESGARLRAFRERLAGEPWAFYFRSPQEVPRIMLHVLKDLGPSA